MKPAYFPFTHVSRPVAAVLSLYFPQIAVYRSSVRKDSDKACDSKPPDTLDIRVPVTGDERELAGVLKNFREWARMHKGDEIAFFKALGNHTPFFDDLSSAQIRADIKRIDSDSGAPKRPNPLFAARLFLDLAQEFDRQNEDLQQDLRALETMELDLVNRIAGEEMELQLDAERKMPPMDPGCFMVTERMRAWARLVLQDTELPGLFITSSRAVLDWLIDKAPEIEKVFCFRTVEHAPSQGHSLEKWRDRMVHCLETLSSGKWPTRTETLPPPVGENGTLNAKISFFIVPAATPKECLERWSGTERPAKRPTPESADRGNTLLGLVEF